MSQIEWLVGRCHVSTPVREAHPEIPQMGLRRALRMALATIECQTGNGCQNPRALLTTETGIDYDLTVRVIRAALDRK